MDAGDKPKLSWSREYWLHHPTQQRVPNEDPRVPKTIDAAKKAHDWFLIGSQADIADGFYRRDLDMSTSADAKPLYFATWHPSGGRVVDLVRAGGREAYQACVRHYYGGAFAATLGAQAIGAAGELLVQYRLLKRGIDSARMTTDSGIDLVMYVPDRTEAVTVQVKTIVAPFLDGGVGPLIVGWFLPRNCKAQWIAGVDISRDRVWLMPTETALHHASGNAADVMLYWRLNPPRGTKVGIETDFERYEIDTVVDGLLGGDEPQLP